MKLRTGICALGFLALACSEPEPTMMEPAPPLPTEVSLDDFCAVAAKAECERLDRCDRLYEPWSLETCESWQLDSKCSALADQYRKIQNLGHIMYDASAAASCRAARQREVVQLQARLWNAVDLEDPEIGSARRGTALDGRTISIDDQSLHRGDHRQAVRSAG